MYSPDISLRLRPLTGGLPGPTDSKSFINPVGPAILIIAKRVENRRQTVRVSHAAIGSDSHGAAIENQ